MNSIDLIRSAIGNTFRAKARSILTMLAIFVGAFTLALTSALGSGINDYLKSSIESFGAENVMAVFKTRDTGAVDSEPRVYEAQKASKDATESGVTADYMSEGDLDEVAEIEGVEQVIPDPTLSIDYVQHGNGSPYVLGARQIVPNQNLQLAAGETPELDGLTKQAALPSDYLEPLGYENAEDAVGSTITIGLTDAAGNTHETSAEVVGVSEWSIAVGLGQSALSVNRPLATDLTELQQEGMPSELQDLTLSAFVQFDNTAPQAEIDALKERLNDAGYTASTLDDQLGVITSIIDGIVFVLNAFAIIALLAASFGIVNTLYMSVQERTREIGLMKAMGMRSGRVFGLFSLEAVFIGLLGSAIGVGIAMLAGFAASSVLQSGFLADLDGLQLFVFEPVSVAVIVATVMCIAFLAGTLPAARAAKQDPVNSLRYE